MCTVDWRGDWRQEAREEASRGGPGERARGPECGKYRGPSLGKEDSGSGEERCKAWQIWEDGAGAPDGRVRKKVVGGKAGRGEVKADIVDLLSLPSPGTSRWSR